MVLKAFEGTDVGVEQDMFSGEKRTVVVEGKGKINQADLFAHGKLQQLKSEAKQQVVPKVLTGDTSMASGPDMDTEYKFQYKIMDLGDVIASHTTAMAPNPKYTTELQPRVRDRAASRLQVEKIAKGLKPKALLVDVEALDRGPMIIGPDNMVESGNGRVIALKIAANEYPENFAEYRAGLIHRSKKYGFDPDVVAAMKQPVLVRERTSNVDRKQFVAEANQMAVMSMSPYEQAIQDSKNIKDSTLASLTVSENQSIDQALLSAANRPLAREFADSLPNNERAAILDDKGNLNQTGLQRLKAALFAKTYPGEAGRRLTKTFFESLDPTVKSIENGLFASLPAIAKSQGLIKAGERYSDLAIAEDLSKSVDMLARLKETGLSPEKYVAQSTMLDRELTPTQEKLLLYLHGIGRSPKKVREFVQEYASKVENSPHPKQASMFGAGERVRKGDILEKLTGKQFDTSAGSGADSPRLEGSGAGSGSPAEPGTKDKQTELKRVHKPIEYVDYTGNKKLNAKSYLEYKDYKIVKEFDRAYNIVDKDNQTVSIMAGIKGAVDAIDSGKHMRSTKDFYIEAALKQRYPGLQYTWWKSDGNWLIGPYIHVQFKGGGNLKPNPNNLLKEGKEIVENGAKQRLLKVSMDDLSFEKATRSHEGTSHSPDSRGRYEQAEYVDQMYSLQDELMAKVPKEQWPQLAQLLKDYQQQYISKTEGLLSQHSNIVSTLVAGPANFPVRQMEKRNKAYDNRVTEFLNWNRKTIDRIKKDVGITKPKVSEITDTDKLSDMIAKAEKTHESMLAANKILRNKKLSNDDKYQKLIEVGIGPGTAAEMLRPNSDNAKIPQWELTSNREKIKRWKAKLDTLSKPQLDEISFNGGSIIDNVEANRTQIYFDSKPDSDTRNELKRNGFKWSPKAGVWQRQRSDIAVRKAKDIVGINNLSDIPPDLPHLLNPVDTNKEENVVYGALNDPRSDENIAKDMRSNQPLANRDDWVPEKTDLTGWDTTDIKEHQEAYEDVFGKVKTTLEKSFKDEQIEGRVKTLPSIVKKLKKKNRDNGPFTHNNMEDIAGIRVTFDEISDLKAGVTAIKGKYKVLEDENYITSPKAGYRSHHLTIEQNGKPLEVQFRTPNMTKWADWTHNILYDHTDVTKKTVGESGFKQLQDYAQAMSDYYAAKDEGKNPDMPTAPAVVKRIGGPMDVKFPKPQKAAYPATSGPIKGERQISPKRPSEPESPKPVKQTAKKSGRWPVVVVTQADIDRVQGNRSVRAIAMDEAQTSKKVRTRDDAGPWLRHPDRYDLTGVDTRKPKKQPKKQPQGRITQRTRNNGTIKRGKRGRRTPGVISR